MCFFHFFRSFLVRNWAVYLSGASSKGFFDAQECLKISSECPKVRAGLVREISRSLRVLWFFFFILFGEEIRRFHMMSRRPYWCSKTIKRRASSWLFGLFRLFNVVRLEFTSRYLEITWISFGHNEYFNLFEE